MRISDWSSDECSSDLQAGPEALQVAVLEFDPGDFVMIVQQKLRMVGDGERQYAFAQGRQVAMAAHQAGARQPVGYGKAPARGACALARLRAALPLPAAAWLKTRPPVAAATRRLKEGVQSFANILLVVAAAILVGGIGRDPV